MTREEAQPSDKFTKDLDENLLDELDGDKDKEVGPSSPPNSPYRSLSEGDVTFSKSSKTHNILVSNFGK